MRDTKWENKKYGNVKLRPPSSGTNELSQEVIKYCEEN